MIDPIPFEETEVRDYLDKCIEHWRALLDRKADPPAYTNAEAAALMAIYYIDAFQSVRVTLFGETLS